MRFPDLIILIVQIPVVPIVLFIRITVVLIRGVIGTTILPLNRRAGKRCYRHDHRADSLSCLMRGLSGAFVYLFCTLLGQSDLGSHRKLLDREICSLATGKIDSLRGGWQLAPMLLHGFLLKCRDALSSF